MSQTAEEKLITITVNSKKWNKIRELCQVDHEHYEGMNECSICDEPLIDVITRKLEKLQTLKEEVLDLGFMEVEVMGRKQSEDGSFSGHRENTIVVEREEVLNLISNLEDK